MAKPGVDPRFADPHNFDGYWPPDWDARQQLVVKRDDWTCQNCNTRNPDNLCTIPEQPIDHGGSFELWNLITLCEDCKFEFQQSNEAGQGTAQSSNTSGPEKSSTEDPGQSLAAGTNSTDQQETDASAVTVETDPESEPNETVSGLKRAVVAFGGGTVLAGTYIGALVIASIAPDWMFSLVFLGLPFAGLATGPRWPLSTVVALGYVALFYIAIAPFAPPSMTVTNLRLWIPFVVPLVGFAYGLAADHYDLSLRDRLRRPQILD